MGEPRRQGKYFKLDSGRRETPKVCWVYFIVLSTHCGSHESLRSEPQPLYSFHKAKLAVQNWIPVGTYMYYANNLILLALIQKENIEGFYIRHRSLVLEITYVVWLWWVQENLLILQWFQMDCRTELIIDFERESSNLLFNHFLVMAKKDEETE